jgi:hypothetical protein
VGFVHDVVLRGNAETTLYRLQKGVDVVNLRTQPFQFEAERRTDLRSNAQLSAP